MLHVVFNGKQGATYGISGAVKREEFTTHLLELGEPSKSIFPGRYPSWVYRVSIHEISDGEVGQRSIWIAVDRDFVPYLYDSQETLEHQEETGCGGLGSPTSVGSGIAPDSPKPHVVSPSAPGSNREKRRSPSGSRMGS